MHYFFYYFLLLLLCNSVFCESCVTVDFENGLDDFTNTVGYCHTLDTIFFNTELYSTRNMNSPHPRSTRFIEPQHTERSCVTTFNFTMTGGGTLEVNGWAFNNSLINLWADIYDARNNSIVTVRALKRWDALWEPTKIIIPGSGSFLGYVLFETTRASNETVGFIDSFRYIPPSVDENSCVIYEEIATTNAPTSTTTQTPTSRRTTTEVPTETTNSEGLITTTISSAPSTATTATEAVTTTTTASTEAPLRLTKFSITKFLKIDTLFS